MPRPDWIEVGQIARPHGVRGEVRVMPNTDNPDRFAPGAVLYARPFPARGRPSGTSAMEAEPPERRLLRIAAVRGTPDSPIIAFAEIEDRGEAESLCGHLLEVPGDDLPLLEEGEFYPWELGGLEVRLAGGERVGRVLELLEAPANDVLVVQLDAGERILLPFVEEAVPVVDVTAGYAVVDQRFLEAE